MSSEHCLFIIERRAFFYFHWVEINRDAFFVQYSKHASCPGWNIMILGCATYNYILRCISDGFWRLSFSTTDNVNEMSSKDHLS